MNFIVCTECAIEHNGRFLIIKRPAGEHAAGLLAFPGGKFEISDGDQNNDVMIQAVKREVLEEVGLELLDPIEYVTSSYFKDTQTNQDVMDIIYHCQLNKTTVEVKASPREVPEYYWLTYDEIISKENCPEWMVKYMGLIIRS